MGGLHHFGQIINIGNITISDNRIKNDVTVTIENKFTNYSKFTFSTLKTILHKHVLSYSK